MKTSRLLIIIATAIVLACAAPAAHARPMSDPAGVRTAAPTTVAPVSVEQLSEEQYLASHGTGAPVESLTDGTDTGGRFPLVLVLAGLAISFGLGYAAIAARPVRAGARHRRPPVRST